MADPMPLGECIVELVESGRLIAGRDAWAALFAEDCAEDES